MHVSNATRRFLLLGGAACLLPVRTFAAEQLLQDGDDPGFAHQRMEEGIALEDGRLEPPHPRQTGRMAGLEVVELVVGADAARLGDDAVGERAQLGELLALDQARDHQVAVAPIVFDLPVGEHAKP